jgi:hypothetical protein
MTSVVAFAFYPLLLAELLVLFLFLLGFKVPQTEPPLLECRQWRARLEA